MVFIKIALVRNKILKGKEPTFYRKKIDFAIPSSELPEGWL